MSKFPRITFGIIVLNGEPFTRYCLRALYPFAHEIIVVEGACEKAAAIATPNGHSVDGTLETLYRFKAEEDPEDKVQIIIRDGFWSEKDEQSQAYAKLATGDYLWQVDVDEFYKPEDMQEIIEILRRNPRITGVSFQTINFWGGFDYYTDGWWIRENKRYIFRRLFKWGLGYHYITHRPPTVVDGEGKDLTQLRWLSGKLLAHKGISLYHYSYVFPDQVRQKCTYFARAFSWEQIEEWAVKQYLNLENPYRLNAAYWLPGWIARFRGTHPPAISELMENIGNGIISINLRDTSDIQHILANPVYQLTTSFLSFLCPAGTSITRLLRKIKGLCSRIKRAIWSSLLT